MTPCSISKPTNILHSPALLTSEVLGAPWRPRGTQFTSGQSDRGKRRVTSFSTGAVKPGLLRAGALALGWLWKPLCRWCWIPSPLTFSLLFPSLLFSSLPLYSFFLSFDFLRKEASVWNSVILFGTQPEKCDRGINTKNKSLVIPLKKLNHFSKL